MSAQVADSPIWIRTQGHDVLDAGEFEADQRDRTLLDRAVIDNRILITMDSDFGDLVYVGRMKHAGLVRLPDVPVRDRIGLMAELLVEYREALERQAFVTIRGGRIRITHPRRS